MFLYLSLSGGQESEVTGAARSPRPTASGGAGLDAGTWGTIFVWWGLWGYESRHIYSGSRWPERGNEILRTTETLIANWKFILIWKFETQIEV